jgi:hypothetical protein
MKDMIISDLHNIQPEQTSSLELRRQIKNRKIRKQNYAVHVSRYKSDERISEK